MPTWPSEIRKDYPATAQSLQAMRDEEDGHRHRLISLYQERFGEHIPLVRRQDVKGFITRKPLWLAANLPGARPSLGAWDGLRSHDHGGRHRSHASLLNFRLLLCDVCRRGHRRGRTRGHRVDSPPLHGYATALGGLSGHRGRRARFHRRHLDRLCLEFFT
jgi:hypothetical protein